MKRVLILLAAMVLFASHGYAADGDLVIDGNATVGLGVVFPDGSSQTTAAKLPAGMITMYGGSSAPSGWLLANGAAVSRTTYAALYAAIGTKFGAGDGSTTFNLPNFNGVFPKGAGSQTISGIAYSGTLGTKSTDKMQGHEHIAPVNNGANSFGSSGYAAIALNGSSVSSQVLPKTGWAVTDGTNGTPRTGNTTEPQSLVINFIIKH